MPNRSGVWNLNTVLQAKNATNWPTRPDAPTGVSATAGDQEATVSFTPPSFQGIPDTIIDYRATSTPEGITATASSSPITVTGLTNDTSYTFTVAARNELGYGAEGGPSGSVTPSEPPLAYFLGGNTGSVVNNIDTITIDSTGNATDFGDLTSTRSGGAACSSNTRGVYSGGVYYDNVIQYITLASTGNASDFGDMSQNKNELTSVSNSTRGLIGGGNTGTRQNVIEYITISSTGNSTDFGDLTVARGSLSSSSSPTRAVFAGGLNVSVSNVNTMDYVTIASTGNATDFGDLLLAAYDHTQGNASSGVRGLFAGNHNTSNVIQYITIASTGNATDFGDLTVSINSSSSASSSVRGVFAGGSEGGGRRNVISYVTIATTGNATDFGDLTSAKNYLAGCSTAHGGLA